MSVYTQNHNIDGWPVCKDGEPMGRKDCLAELQKLESQISALKEENERLKARAVVLEKAITAVDELICQSSGVSGLHLNGEMAPWSDLLEGGHYEPWLIDFSAALKEPAND